MRLTIILAMLLAISIQISVSSAQNSTLNNVTIISDRDYYSCFPSCAALINITNNGTLNTTADINITNYATVNATFSVYEMNGSWIPFNGTNHSFFNLSTYSFLINITLPAPATGKWNFSVVVNSSGLYNYTLDPFIDSINLSYPADNSFLSNSTPRFNFTLLSNATQTCSVYVNSTVWVTNDSVANNTLISMINGSLTDTNYTWYVSCNQTGISSVRMFIIDTISPFINISMPGNNTNTSASSTIFNFTAFDNNTLNCSISFNGTIQQLNASVINATLTWFNLSMPDGNYNWSIRCQDPAGNSNAALRYIKIDKSPPILINFTPTATLINYTTVNFTYNWTDLSAISCNLEINNTNYSMTVSEKTCNYTLAGVDGNYSYKVFVNDSLGNINMTNLTNLYLDSTNPWVNITFPDNGTYFNISEQINFTIRDNFNFSLSCDLYINDALNQSAAGLYNNTSYSFGLNLSDASYNWGLRCSDNATNINVTNRTFFVDKPPLLNDIYPNETAVTSYRDVTFRYNVSEYLPNANCTLYVNYLPYQSFLANSTNYSYQTSFVNGVYTWFFLCRDQRNNTSPISPRNITIAVSQAEICCNGYDDDNDGYTDRNCYCTAGSSYAPVSSAERIISVLGNLTEVNQSKINYADLGISVNQTFEITGYQGEKINRKIHITNTESKVVYVNASVTETIENITKITNIPFGMPKNSEADVEMEIYSEIAGIYKGKLFIFAVGERSYTVDVNINILQKQQPLIKMIAEVMNKSKTGVEFSVTLYNFGNVPAETNITYNIRDINGTLLYSENETKTVKDSVVLFKRIEKNLSSGEYMVEVTGSYFNLTANAVEPFKIESPNLMETIKDNSWWFSIFGIVAGLYLLRKKIHLPKKKSEYKITYKNLPKTGFYAGHIRGTGRPALINDNDLLTHTMISGATGCGKTLAAQVITEELLRTDIPVIVLDPTKQWTGFIEECHDEKMMENHNKFGIRPGKFKTNIISVNANSNIDIKEMIEKGTITVVIPTEKSVDDTARKLVDSVFDANLPESSELKLVIIFDEVHRLLPKYGGDKGYLALERAAREFRKWGIGIIMVSQVTTDFRSAIRANLSTEIQFRTSYTGDLERIKMKYGSFFKTFLTHAETGIAMIQNPKYNDGKPYVIEFRPVMHNPHRLGADALEIIDVLNKELADIKEEMKKSVKDVSGIEFEYKTAVSKLHAGEYRIAKLYIDAMKNELETL